MSVAEIGWLLGYHGGELPVYVDQKPNPARLLSFDSERARSSNRLAAAVAHLDGRLSHEVAVGLPQIKGYVHNCTVLWAWVKGSEQMQWAQKFARRSAPTIALQLGSSSERLLLWALKTPVAEISAEAANARLSYALHAPRTRSKPTALRIPMPGTYLRVGRERPAAVTLTRMEDDVYTLDELTGALKEPPARDAWKEAKR